ncbi:adenylyl-sulfate kinase [Sulfurospirillum sp.]|uniref:adenylyl-sulfate kinase n=1 Tax=Sulfurospirillum sp. TaxID=2053622 RepID=UPI002FDCDBA9
MLKETNIRSVVKGITYRVAGTCTTMLIVFLFVGRLDLAFYTGLAETFSKIGLYWLHERVWLKVRWGRKKIEPFNIWLTGLPLCGKTTVGDLVHQKLRQLDIPLERIDSKDIRELIPDIGFTRNSRNQHLHRVGHLICTLQKNAISTVASFVSPYEESREIIANMVKNNIIVYIKADIETCKKRDYKHVYEKAICGEYQNFTGISDVYEEPKHADIVIDTDEVSAEEAAEHIIKFIKKRYIK